MKKFFSIVILTLLCGFIYAATPRAVVLSKITIDGRAVDSKPLLSTVEHEMKQKGFRIVDIATSLMAQYTTLEKKIKQG
ncbi:hypothetical protein KAH37_05460, partial [bacterium]|nr:hypothetical protein [bacterium]